MLDWIKSTIPLIFPQKQSVNYEFKYCMLSATLFHFCVAIISFIFSIKLFAWYSIVVVIFYAICTYLINIENVIVIFLMAGVEFVFNIFVLYMCTGSTYAGELYLVLLIPTSFYIVFTNYSNNMKIIFVGLTFFYTLVTYSIFYNEVLVYIIEPFRINKSDSVEYTLTTFHIISSFTIMVIITFFYIRRMNIDIEKMKIQAEILSDEAMIDQLTRLYNRRKMASIIQEFHKRYELNDVAFTMGMGDIDFFKSVNDTYGHNVGDEVLKAVSKIFMENRGDGNFVGRWGGEEFIFIFATSDILEVINITKKIKQEVENAIIEVGDDRIKVTVTIGLSVISKGQDITNLLDIVDSNLYRGKKEGRNRVVTDINSYT